MLIYTQQDYCLLLLFIFSLHPLRKVTWYRAGWVRDTSSHPRSTVPAAVRRSQSRIRVLRAAICPFCSRPSRIRPPRRSARLLWPPLVLPVAASSGVARRGSSPSRLLPVPPVAAPPRAAICNRGRPRRPHPLTSSLKDPAAPTSIRRPRPQIE